MPWSCARGLLERARYSAAVGSPAFERRLSLLAKKGMQPGAPVFVRIFKEESELEMWKQRDDGRFYHFKTYPICNWSGEIGPKQVRATGKRLKVSTRSRRR